MQSIEALWWLLFYTAFGLCTGSFLNVVVFRIPRDISLRNPLWSFCPGCHARIHWYDNLPLLSYLLLSGRCRSCGMRISPRYPLFETLGAFIALILFDAFFIAHTHGGVGRYFQSAPPLTGLTWQISQDWPIYIAHFVLFAALLAMSAIDIEHYWVDVRFTWFATGAGFVLHAVWSPRDADAWHYPSAPLAAGAIVATAVLAVTALLLYRRHVPAPHPEREDTPDFALPAFAPIFAGAPGAHDDPDDLPEECPALSPTAWLARPAFWAAVATLVVLLVGAWTQATGIGPQIPPAARWMPILALFFLLIVTGGMPRRESDHAIIAAIEAERHSARRVAASELATLLPAVVVGGLVLYWAGISAHVTGIVESAVHWSPIGGWQPVRGLSTAAAGFIIGGAIGWFVRIAATFIMGREAFGTGDIHMMAAAGCVAGWPVVLLGFVLCSVLALAGWLLLVPFKRSRAIPLGPWLSIAFLIVVVFFDAIQNWTPVRNVIAVFGDPADTFRNLTQPLR